jgi:alkylation response protein AidB-like acyl-CoA dehydrogenase
MPHIYGLDETAKSLSAKAATLAKDVLGKHAEDVDTKARFPEESIAALSAEGFMGLCVPIALGGKGQGPRAFVAVVEELAQACGSTAMIYVMHTAATQAIAASTTFEKKDEVLKSIAAGKHLTTLSLSEKGSRSHFWAPVSKLTPQGDGFLTSAFKSWITSASRADSYVSSAQRPDAKSPLESTVFLARNPLKNGARVVSKFDGLGLRGNDSAPVSIEAMKIGKGDLITPQGEGAKSMLEVILPWFAVGAAAMSAGLCRAALSITATHLSTAGFDHLGSKLRDLQVLRARLAEMSVKTDQARALLGYTCGELEAPSAMTPLFVLETRLAGQQAADEVTDLAMKACGGAAFSRQLGLERVFRDARAGWVMAPTVDHLQDFVGKALTGLPLF